MFYLSFCSNKKEKALKTISFSKLFPYLCLFLLRLRKNEVENNADDGGKTDLGHRKLFCIHSRYSLLVFQTLLIPVEEFLHTILNLYLMRPAEAVELIYRDELAHGSIWLAGVKLYLAFETYCLYYKLRKFTDGKFPYRFLLYKS